RAATLAAARLAVNRGGPYATGLHADDAGSDTIGDGAELLELRSARDDPILALAGAQLHALELREPVERIAERHRAVAFGLSRLAEQQAGAIALLHPLDDGLLPARLVGQLEQCLRRDPVRLAEVVEDGAHRRDERVMSVQDPTGGAQRTIG